MGVYCIISYRCSPKKQNGGYDKSNRTVLTEMEEYQLKPARASLSLHPLLLSEKVALKLSSKGWPGIRSWKMESIMFQKENSVFECPVKYGLMEKVKR